MGKAQVRSYKRMPTFHGKYERPLFAMKRRIDDLKAQLKILGRGADKRYTNHVKYQSNVKCS